MESGGGDGGRDIPQVDAQIAADGLRRSEGDGPGGERGPFEAETPEIIPAAGGLRRTVATRRGPRGGRQPF